MQANAAGRLVHTRWEIRPRDCSPLIRGEVRALPDASPESAVILCHGFKGFREWGFFPVLATAIASRGHAAITFDFSRNGVGDDGVDFSALDLFATNTHSRNLDEIRAVTDAVASGDLLAQRPGSIALFGHSRGGAEAILAAAVDSRIRALVTWSALAVAAERWSPGNIAAWERGETISIANSRTGQQMPIGPDYWRDIVENRERLDILASAARIDVPWLLVHGDHDETVAVADAHRLFELAGSNARLHVVEGATHTFGAGHPYSGATPELRTAASATLEWLDTNLA